jgi:hypothetical protein
MTVFLKHKPLHSIIIPISVIFILSEGTFSYALCGISYPNDDSINV